jgi:hypothetical protein
MGIRESVSVQVYKIVESFPSFSFKEGNAKGCARKGVVYLLIKGKDLFKHRIK